MVRISKTIVYTTPTDLARERKPHLPVVIRVSSVPVFRREYSHPWLRFPDTDLEAWTLDVKPKTWNLNPAPHPRPPRAQLERTPFSPSLSPQQLTNITRNTFSKLERPAVPSPTFDLGLWTLDLLLCERLPTSHVPKPSSAAPNRSSNLPNRSSNLPKCSSRAQLEPFPNDPVFATLSRQTTYNFAPENSTSHLSVPLPLADSPRNSHPQSTCNQYPRDHNANHAANHRLLLAVLLYPRVRGAACGAPVVSLPITQTANRPEDHPGPSGFFY